MLSMFLCPDSNPNFLGLLDTSIAPPLLFYSYLPIICISIFFGLFVLLKTKFSLEGKLLFGIALSFSVFIFNEIIQWIAAPASLVFLGWHLAPLFQIMVWIFTIYFSYVFLNKKDLGLNFKVALMVFTLPIILLLPTKLNNSFFDLVNCEGVVDKLWIYLYAFQVISIIIISFLGFWKYKKCSNENIARKKQIAFFTLGTVIFLSLFFLSNVFGEIFQTYEINLIGPIGIVIFLGFLAYLIVRYQVFDIKLISAQALVIGIFILIGSQFFFIKNPINKILTGITLVFTAIFGWWLIKAVKDEIRQKEEMAELTRMLATANQKLKRLDAAKTEFLSIASHQLRAPLTAIKGFASLLLEGSYGEIHEDARVVIKKIEISNERLAQLTENLLNVSRIESGRLTFDFAKNSVEEIVKTVIGELEPTAKGKNLYVKYEGPSASIPSFVFDKNKMHEVFMNLLDNAIKYTPQGGITVKLENLANTVKITFTDTGIGIPLDELSSISTKFHRAENARKAHVDGTGIGVYLVSQILKNHNASLTIASEGENKGSVFTVEMDKNFKAENGGNQEP